MRYEPTWESIAQHPVPDWFHDAKLGLLVVWGLFSVPGWAPLTGDFDQVVKERGWETFKQAIQEKWECNRGLAHSYSFNRNEGAENYLSVAEIVRLLVDVVSKNGNLLLSFGPMADGTVPELQRERLEGLGAWLDVNGEAIFGTRPWLTAEGYTRERIPVRFTHKADALYAALWDLPPGRQVTLEGLQADNASTIYLLGFETPLPWKQEGEALTIGVPGDVAASPAYCLKITPIPRLLTRVSG